MIRARARIPSALGGQIRLLLTVDYSAGALDCSHRFGAAGIHVEDSVEELPVATPTSGNGHDFEQAAALAQECGRFQHVPSR